MQKGVKACGVDNIPVDVLKNDCSVVLIFFNICTIPDIWNKSIPIPKSSGGHARDPLSYRGITLACIIYKLYAALLNNRLPNWADRV